MARTKGFTDISRVPQMKRRLRELRDTRIKVGVLEGEGDLAMIYAVNELGTTSAGKGNKVTIPERSTLRATADSRQSVNAATKDASDVIDIARPALKPLNVIGINFAEEVREKIRSNVPPENAPSTRASKDSARTLIDKGRLVGAIEHEVV